MKRYFYGYFNNLIRFHYVYLQVFLVVDSISYGVTMFIGNKLNGYFIRFHLTLGITSILPDGIS